MADHFPIFHIYYVYMEIIKFLPFVGSFGVRMFVEGKGLEGSNFYWGGGGNFRLILTKTHVTRKPDITRTNYSVP